MKKIISVLFALALVAGIAQAQDKQEKKNGHDWREKVRAVHAVFDEDRLLSLLRRVAPQGE